MINKKQASFIVALCLYGCGFFVVSSLRLYFWMDLISPLGSISAAMILLRNYLKSVQAKKIKMIWLLLGIACIFWSAADIAWAVFRIVLRLDAQANGFIAALYSMTNVFYAAELCYFVKSQIKRFRGIQLFLDSLAFSASTVMLIWIVFFDKDLASIQTLLHQQLRFTLSLGLDFVIITGIFIWSFSLYRRKVSPALLLLILGIALFFLTDLCYLYACFKNLYAPDSFLDCTYNASFLLTAIGACLYRSNTTGDVPGGLTRKTDYIKGQTIGFIRYRCSFLLLFPVIVILIKGFSLEILLQYSIIIGLYLCSTFYVRTSIKNEYLLDKEKKLNAILEEQVKQRTKELIQKNSELDFISNQDTVTSLYNRRYFMSVLDRKIQFNNPTETVALLFMDLDRFKSINDTYGHLLGDQVLLEIARRLKCWNSENSLLARLGGDEFIFLYTGQVYYTQLKALAQKIIESCSDKIEIGEYVVHVTMSIGISIYPLDAQSSEELIRNADIAMYYAKAKGANQCVSFNYMLETKSKRKNEIEMLLKKADYDSEFTVYYQPQFSIPDKKLIGMEALLRWNPPGEEPIEPSEFIPIAEEINCIAPIGEWVMRQAVRQIARWNRQYGLNLKMGINVSPKQLDSKNFFPELEKAIKNNAIVPKWLNFEITESFAVNGLYHVTEVASMFNDLGVSISIDDFGTGYSSLSYLKSFPFDRIKIAKTLIDAIAERGYDMNITKSIILLADSIGVKTIAEGVESEEQLDILKELGCTEIQGFLFSKPLPAAVFEDTFLKHISFNQSKNGFA